MENLISHIQSIQASLPKRQRLLCDYICNHLFEASMLTIAELAEKTGVGTATVTRMVYSLGYTSYNQFKLDLREQAMSHAKSSYDVYWNMYQDNTGEFGISDELDACQSMVHGMNNPLFVAQIEAAAEAILSARRTYILGLRTSLVSALCLEYRLIDEGINVYSLSKDPEFIFDRLISIDQEDILIAFASKPATKKTLDTLRICHGRGVPTLLITTAPFKEMEPYTSFLINSNTFDALLAIVPPIITVELLSREISRRSGRKNQDRYQRVEKLIRDNGVTIWG